MAAHVPPDDSGDQLDDEIAALEAAERLAQPALNVDFDELLDKAEHGARDA